MDIFVPRGNITGPILPEFILKLSIPAGAKLLYSVLCGYSYDKGFCWPSHSTLAKRLGCSINTIKNHLQELVKCKLVAIKKENYHSSKFFLLPPPEELQPASTKSDASFTQTVKTNPNLSTIESDPSKFDDDPSKIGYLNNLKNTKKENSTPPIPRVDNNSFPDKHSHCVSGGGISFSDFEKVYEAYPRKEAKGLAKIAWHNLLRSGSLPNVDIILQAIERFKSHINWQRENGRFIPQLSNFLKGERWNDPLSEAEIKEKENKKIVEQRQKQEEEFKAARRKEFEAKQEKYLPVFNAFAAKFKEPFHFPAIFAMWLHLAEQNLAPLEKDVPDDNKMEIYQFITWFKKNYHLLRRVDQTDIQTQIAAKYNQTDLKFQQSKVNTPTNSSTHGPVAVSSVLSDLLSSLKLNNPVEIEKGNKRDSVPCMVGVAV